MIEKTLRVQDDTSIHVAQFLQEGVGATRQARIVLDQLPLDDDLTAGQVESGVKLTRIPTGIRGFSFLHGREGRGPRSPEVSAPAIRSTRRR